LRCGVFSPVFQPPKAHLRTTDKLHLYASHLQVLHPIARRPCSNQAHTGGCGYAPVQTLDITPASASYTLKGRISTASVLSFLAKGSGSAMPPFSANPWYWPLSHTIFPDAYSTLWLAILTSP